MIYTRSKVGALFVVAGLSILPARIAYQVYHPSKKTSSTTPAAVVEKPVPPIPIARTTLEKSLDAEFRKAQPDLWGYKAVTLSNNKKYVAGPEGRDEKTGCVIAAARLMFDTYKGVKMNVLENVPSVGPIIMCLPEQQPAPGN